MSALFRYASDTLAHYYRSSPDEHSQERMSDGTVRLSAALSAALAALPHQSFKPPKLVVVGTQSSGKSSLLNALMGVQLLPTGETMTTRAAIQVQLVNSPERRVEFGTFLYGTWAATRTIQICDPPTPDEHAAVRNHIASETARLLNGSRGVLVETPICLRLYSATVPNMSFVDLPGITMHALTSEGQPADMCDQIRNLIRSYIDDRTTVLMVCAARADLEADAAVELCMSVTGGKRTVGCLTKPDLCDTRASIAAYVNGRGSSDLRLEHGYFVVRCRCGESEPMSDVYTSETSFFRSHPTLGDCAGGERVGVLKLGSFVHSIVLQSVRACLPQLRGELVEMRHAAAEECSSKLQYSIPDSEHGKAAFVTDMLTSFSRRLNRVITSHKPDAPTGRVLRDTFADLRTTLREADPFASVPDSEILEAIHNCEGWSMVSPVPPVAIVEYFMQHAEHRPIQWLRQPCVSCIHEVQRQILVECEQLCTSFFCRFTRLHEWVTREFAALQGRVVAETVETLSTILHIEEAYIFTDDSSFVQEWLAATKHSPSRGNYASVLRTILTSYFRVVANSLAGQIPKLIVYHVTRMLDETQACLQNALQRVASVSDLLFETEEIENLRTRLTNTIRTADECLSIVDQALQMS